MSSSTTSAGAAAGSGFSATNPLEAAGDNFIEKGNHLMAISAYKKSLSTTPFEAARINQKLGSIYSELSNYEEAEKFFTTSISLCKEEDPSSQNLANTYKMRGKMYEKQAMSYKTSLGGPVRDVPTLELAAQNNALSDYREVAALRPDPAIHILLGLLHGKMGNRAEQVLSNREADRLLSADSKKKASCCGR